LDKKVITVSAIPARPPSSRRLARKLGLDRNPLRRATDRALSWIRVAVVAAFLTGGPLVALGVGNWMHHAATAEARRQAAQRHTARAVLLQPTPLPAATMAIPRWGDQAWVRARWEINGAATRTGHVLATLGLPAGSLVTIWLDASGRLTVPPLQPGQIADRTVAVAALAPAILAIALLAALWLARRLVDRRRLADWDAAWSAVGPEWTRRGP
jgi:hypothetical protein